LKQTLHISVGALVEYSLLSGDLNRTFFSSDRPIQAIRIHQRIQDSRPKEYQAEVSVHHLVKTDKYDLQVSGRIDGVYRYPGRAVIEEIKTTRRPLVAVREEENGVHWGQAKCYAYIYCIHNDLNSIEIQLTYYNLDSDKSTEIRRVFDITELEEFFDSLVSKYLEWADTIIQWIKLRDQSIKKMRFPFEQYRVGQSKMLEEAESAIADRAELLIQAPTGIGKTMAVIFPAVRSIDQGRTNKVFYLTARTTGRNAAEQSLRILRNGGLRLKCLSLTAKDKICFNTDKLCSGDDCAYAKGYYDRINEALRDAFGQDSFTRDVILAIAQKHRVCPFEFSLDLSLWVDFVICDYNYVFDPRVYLKRFFQNGAFDYVLLVDEAHNLVDRSREMYSATMHKNSILRLKRHVKTRLLHLQKSLARINSWMIEVANELPKDENYEAKEEYPSDLCQRLREFTTLAEKWLLLNEQTDFREDLLDLYFDARRFLSTADRYDETYATCYTKAGKDLTIKLFCIDPSQYLREVLQKCAAAIFFSATLTPMQYFVKLLGCSEIARTLSLPSPFPYRNLRVLIAGKVSALYKYREFTKHEVARMISAMIDQRKGNYFIFFPSYEYMRMIHEIFQKRRPRVHIIMQEPGMSEPARDRFLARFSGRTDGFLTGFAVMGGVFAESIDLVGERLTGATIVGVGLPQISLERELIKNYFDNVDGSGFAFSYQIPGMIRVLQAAGRVIRSDEDRGVVLLIDTRYSNPPYRLMLPQEWRPLFVDNVDKVGTVLQDFWRR